MLSEGSALVEGGGTREAFAGAGYAVLKPPMLASSALVMLPPSTHNMAAQAVIADSDPVLASSLRSIHPAATRLSRGFRLSGGTTD